MGTHLIPRSNVKGQDRFFIFFSVPGLIGTIIGLIPGYIMYSLVAALSGAGNSISMPGVVVLVLFGFIGFVIGQVQVPDNGSLPLFKKIGGLYIREVIVQYFNFNKNKKKFVLQVSENPHARKPFLYSVCLRSTPSPSYLQVRSKYYLQFLPGAFWQNRSVHLSPDDNYDQTDCLLV